MVDTVTAAMVDMAVDMVGIGGGYGRRISGGVQCELQLFPPSAHLPRSLWHSARRLSTRRLSSYGGVPPPMPQPNFAANGGPPSPIRSAGYDAAQPNNYLSSNMAPVQLEVLVPDANAQVYVEGRRPPPRG